MRNIAIHLPSEEWLACWRQETSRLLVHCPSAPPLRERVAVQVQLEDLPACATVVGTAVSVQRLSPGCRVEIAPAVESMRAVQMLCAAARGEQVRFRVRPIRYLVNLPAIVAWHGGRILTSAYSISEGGSALRWPGVLPSIGTALDLRLGAGRQAFDFRGVVCWTESKGTAKVGLRLFTLEGARVAWKRFLADVARTGATVG
jgi:hypothetical protein